MERLTPTSLGALSIGAVTSREVSRALVSLVKSSLAESSVRRYRESLSSFFAWAVRERMILVDPVTGTAGAPFVEPRVEMYPFGEADLERV